jgi:hypothetical protein
LQIKQNLSINMNLPLKITKNNAKLIKIVVLCIFIKKKLRLTTNGLYMDVNRHYAVFNYVFQLFSI